MGGTITGVLTEEETRVILDSLLLAVIHPEMGHVAMIIQDDSLTAVLTPVAVIVVNAEIVIGVL